jgi:hypothetical protein
MTIAGRARMTTRTKRLNPDINYGHYAPTTSADGLGGILVKREVSA